MDQVKPSTCVKQQPHASPCLCAALRQATRAVTRIYDAELRTIGLKTTQHSLLRLLARSGELRQGDLGALAALDETTLTRNLRPLEKSGWITIRAGADRRERLVAITAAGRTKIEDARPAWLRAQERLKQSVPGGTWEQLFEVLPEVTQSAIKIYSGE